MRSELTHPVLPYTELIARYDTPNTLFYLDPRYWGSEIDYGRYSIQARLQATTV